MKCKTCDGSRSFKKTVDGDKTTVNCPICDGTGEVEDSPPAPAPTLADVKALLDKMVVTMGNMADAMVALAESMKGL